MILDLRIQHEPETRTIWVFAYVADREIGRCSVRRSTDHSWYIAHGMVDENHRQKGVFRKMYKALMECVDKRDPWLVSVVCNRTLLPFFEAEGFKTLFSSIQYGYEEWFAVKEYT
jgi:GNAT superfamily N-acetyltransferase